LRLQRGLTQRDVAEALGIPLSTYKEWEYGRRIQGEAAYHKLAEILEVNLRTLLTGEPLPGTEEVIKKVNSAITQLKDIKTALLSF
jgi:transcriptional regulator with XRE-family HTH domain